MKKKKMSFTTVGGSSILTIFAVLCFIVFALLSLSTAQADSTLANKSMDAEKAYYAADTEAEEILAAIRSGECPDDVNKKGNVYSYSCPIDEKQELQVSVVVWNGKYRIDKWQKVYVNKWEADTSMDVWGGTQEIVD